MSEINELELEKQLLETHISRMCETDDVDTLKKLQEMAICRILNIYEFRLDEIIMENAKKLSLADDTIIIRKDYDYMDQCASSYFRVPRE